MLCSATRAGTAGEDLPWPSVTAVGQGSYRGSRESRTPGAGVAFSRMSHTVTLLGHLRISTNGIQQPCGLQVAHDKFGTSFSYGGT